MLVDFVVGNHRTTQRRTLLFGLTKLPERRNTMVQRSIWRALSLFLSPTFFFQNQMFIVLMDGTYRYYSVVSPNATARPREVLPTTFWIEGCGPHAASFWRTARCRNAHLRQMAKRSSKVWNIRTCGKMLPLVSVVFMLGVLQNSRFLLVGENCYRYLGSTLPPRNRRNDGFYSFLTFFLSI